MSAIPSLHGSAVAAHWAGWFTRECPRCHSLVWVSPADTRVFCVRRDCEPHNPTAPALP
jgi:hypothetical protein